MGYRNAAKGHRRLAAWLRGKETPTGDQVQRIAQALRLPFESVFEVIYAEREAQRQQRRKTDPTIEIIISMCAWDPVSIRATLGHRLDDQTAIDMAVERASPKRRCCLNTQGAKLLV